MTCQQSLIQNRIWHKEKIVGGFNPSKSSKKNSQIGSLPLRRVNIKKYLKPPPRKSLKWNKSSSDRLGISISTNATWIADVLLPSRDREDKPIMNSPFPVFHETEIRLLLSWITLNPYLVLSGDHQPHINFCQLGTLDANFAGTVLVCNISCWMLKVWWSCSITSP